jgi:hypothetical protein
VLGFAKPSEKTGVERWTFTPCTAPERWGQYQHGLGGGDVNGDGRPDLLMQGGWWEQPAASPATETPPVWEKHPANFGQGAAQMYALDVDGLQDIVTGKRFWAHGPKGDPDPAGTQLATGDLNGDQRPDIVVGNKKGGFVFLQKPAG